MLFVKKVNIIIIQKRKFVLILSVCSIIQIPAPLNKKNHRNSIFNKILC